MLKRVLVSLGVLLLVVTTGLYLVIKHLDGNITGVQINSGDLGNRPAAVVKGPINVLVMGDDTRKGQGPQIGGATPGLSDTTILLHLSADRKFAYGVSLPRDAMVQRPSCKTSTGVAPAQLTQFNAAYAIGGPLCTMKTVEQLTGVHIDHFVVIKFRGFREMVDALGGVQVCVPEQIDDPQSNIHLPAGTYKVTGEQALNYVRVRHGVGDGSDIGRMKRQQSFIASMINQVVSAGTLANPIKLYKFLDAATKSLITDEGFSHLRSLVGLGESLKSIGLDHIKFVTVPFAPYPPDPNRLVWAPRAHQLWSRIIHDKPLGGSFDSQVINAAHKPGASTGGKTKSGNGSHSSTGGGSPRTSTSGPTPAQIQAAHNVGLCA
ncbi:LCP family protein [Nocardioides terrisoli]|uniref:LCP family protein n=1 Tax=Nocardioides terrisoli TaxID=3388267 RepID=UPI00287B9C78|nr:LCP family protein [Nocardioides marmorisolisilvae]